MAPGQVFGHSDKRHVWTSKALASKHRNTVLAVKHGGGGIMLCGCCVVSGTGTF